MGELKCIRCGKTPEQLPEYQSAAAQEHMNPSQWVRSNEAVGCWGKGPDAFYCTPCYIAAGMPMRKETPMPRSMKDVVGDREYDENIDNYADFCYTCKTITSHQVRYEQHPEYGEIRHTKCNQCGEEDADV